jgi:cytidine deaminase
MGRENSGYHRSHAVSDRSEATPQAIRDELISAALEARKEAYAPHSGFPVGAAIRGASGRIFRGFNVENSSYGLTMCAERIALYTALVAGSGNSPTSPSWRTRTLPCCLVERAGKCS